MNKRILILSVIVIFGLTSITTTAFASTGQLAVPKWVDCRGAHPHGNIEIGATIGQNTMFVAWTAPPTDWEKDGNCIPVPISTTSVTTYVSNTPYNPYPTTVTVHSASASSNFALSIVYCIIPSKYGCSEYGNKPYSLKYGNTVVAELQITYASGESFFGSYTLTVTD